MADLTYEQKIDRLMYTVYGNGEPGIVQEVEEVKEFMKAIDIHHAKEPAMIEGAIEAAFEKRFGKKNSYVLLLVAVTSAIAGLGSMTVMLVK